MRKVSDNVIRRAEKKDISGIISLLHQVNMVHHVLRPDLFKPHTTKYNEQELEALIGDDSKPIFVFEDGAVLGHAFCMVTEVKDDKLLQDIKTLYIDDSGEDRGRYSVSGESAAKLLSSIFFYLLLSTRQAKLTKVK